ncbi:unnamed protein product [Mycena citricolor]|uniref:BTB domain-containing protein n=1 Tax=Mycena citricolor TaxID=2018698 RepID=A0AAD2HGU4_9AGAR|nr:unnamed protein product [Mycena citricolor]
MTLSSEKERRSIRRREFRQLLLRQLSIYDCRPAARLAYIPVISLEPTRPAATTRALPLSSVKRSRMEYDWENAASQYSDFDFSKFDLPTPPRSQDGTPLMDSTAGEVGSTPLDDPESLSISTTFFPDSDLRPHRPDVILLTTDSVHFYLHSDVLQAFSSNQFRSLLGTPTDASKPPAVDVPETAPVLNVILHAIYGLSCVHYAPSFDILADAMNKMPLYGLEPRSMVRPPTPPLPGTAHEYVKVLPSTSLFSQLLSHAPLVPLELYALAAHFDIFDLAVPTSSHLLGYALSRLTDEDAERMGAVYLKRLFFLHYGRVEALKRVLSSPPHPHVPTSSCDFANQKNLNRAWALATAYLSWELRPDLSTSALESALLPLKDQLPCELCKTSLNDRIKILIVQWSFVKRTI